MASTRTKVPRILPGCIAVLIVSACSPAVSDTSEREMAEAHNLPTVVVRNSAKVPARQSPAGTLKAVPLISPADGSANYLGTVTLLAGAKVAPHAHRDAAEYVYILAGRGTMTIGKKRVSFEPGAAIFIPRGHTHAVENSGETAIKAVQFFSPAGPEQRMNAWPLENAAAAKGKFPIPSRAGNIKPSVTTLRGGDK